MEAQEDGFPVDVEEKEAYFMSEVARGEQLAQEGMIDAILLADEEEAIKGGNKGRLRAEANTMHRIRQCRGRSLLLQGTEGLPTAFRLDHHLRQDCSKGKPNTSRPKT